MSQKQSRARTLTLGAAITAGILLAGCGSSTPKGSAGTTKPPATSSSQQTQPATSGETTPPTTGSTAKPASDIAGACAALLRLDAVPQPQEGPDAPPDAAAIKAFGRAAVPPLKEALGKSDAELAASLHVLLPIAQAAAEKGTPIPDDDSLFGALTGYHRWAHQKCGYSKLDVMAVDYKFDGMPRTVKPGPVSLAMTNHSDKGEFHVAVVAKAKDKKITTAKQLLDIPMPQMEGSVEILGSAAAPPGATGGVLLDLKPGRYFLICPVGVGGKEDGSDLHMMHGMITAFEVKA